MLKNIYKEEYDEEDENDEEYEGDEDEEDEEISDEEPDNREEDFKKYGFAPRKQNKKHEVESDLEEADNEEENNNEEIVNDEEEEITEGADGFGDYDNNQLDLEYEDNYSEIQRKIEENFLTVDYKQVKEIGIPYNKLYNFSDYDIYEGKFGNIARIQFSCFDSKTYEPEAPIVFIDEKGHRVEKIFPYDKFIRWRYSNEEGKVTQEKDETEENLLRILNIENQDRRHIESNARIVEWSDGSFQLIIGNEYFDININKSANTRLAVNADNEHALVIGESIKKKMIIKRNFKYENLNRRESISFEDIRKLKENNKEDSKIKTFHSYYNKNKFSTEEYKSKSGKISAALIKQIQKREEEMNTIINNSSNKTMMTEVKGVLGKKRENK